MKRKTKFYLDNASMVFGFSGMLFCGLTHIWLLVIINALCFFWGLTGVTEIANEIKEDEDAIH